VAVKFVYSEAADGIEAVRMVHEASEQGVPFDAVFMDNIMHIMHGPEAAQLMRSAGYEGLIIGSLVM
jgi:CheY-like chemotaxis protein